MSQKDSRRHSILKKSIDDEETVIQPKKKKLSFQSTPIIQSFDADKSVMDISAFKETKHKGGEENLSYRNIFLAENLSITKMGVCYNPPNIEKLSSVSDYIQNGTHKRQEIRSILREDMKQANVMIIGDKVCSREVAEELQKVVKESQLKLVCNCQTTPTEEQIAESDFFIFLVQLDKCYSAMETELQIKEIRHHARGLSFCSVVLGISSHQGSYGNVIPPVQFHDMLVNVQMPSYTLSPTNRGSKKFSMENLYKRILESTNGNTLNHLITWGLTRPVNSYDKLLL